jgi:hypothetical protein
MPPKAKANAAQQKAKAKAVEDKTFGMKNKKGSKAQKVVQNLKSSMVNKVRIISIIIELSLDNKTKISQIYAISARFGFVKRIIG